MSPDALVIGLYDQQGVLRFAGRDVADCLAYAELFGLAPDNYSLQPLLGQSFSSHQLLNSGEAPLAAHA